MPIALVDRRSAPEGFPPVALAWTSGYIKTTNKDHDFGYPAWEARALILDNRQRINYKERLQFRITGIARQKKTVILDYRHSKGVRLRYRNTGAVKK